MKKMNKMSLKTLNLVIAIGILSLFIVSFDIKTNWNISGLVNHPLAASTEDNIQSDVFFNSSTVYRGIQALNITYNDIHGTLGVIPHDTLIANITINSGSQFNITMTVSSPVNSTQYSCLCTPGISNVTGSASVTKIGRAHV